MGEHLHGRVSGLVRGGLLALAAACAFGATTPFLRRFGAGLGPFESAALLYAGSAIASWMPLPGGRAAGAPLRTKDAPRLMMVAVVGAVVAPVCLAWGVQRTTATAASLLLSLEALFTVLLARALYREPIGARVGSALAAIGAGGAVLVVAQGTGGGGAGGGSSASLLGGLAVAAATLAWAADNALTRPLAELAPSHIVVAKGLLGATLSAAIAAMAGEPAPTAARALGLLACGGVGYGASLRLYLGAQRLLGAGRTASMFSVAPFVGAVVAVALGDRPPALATCVAAALCGVGVALHLTEHHGHPHAHSAVAHEHAHVHDDGHHGHPHDPPFAGEHSHPHEHGSVTHDHEHAPDVHHEHEHS